MSERAPVATMSVSARTVGSSASGSPTQTSKGQGVRSTRLTLAVRSSASKRSAWARIIPMSSGPMIAVDEAGVVLHVGGQHQLATGLVAGG